jgi:hypothetical protein
MRRDFQQPWFKETGMDGKYAAFIAGPVNRDFGIGERDERSI